VSAYVLDTNHIIFLLNGEADVRARMNTLVVGDVLMTSLIVKGELLYGASHSQRKAANRERALAALADLHDVLPLSEAVVARWADLKAHLRRIGRPKQDVDLLVVATAIEANATLLTDEKSLLAGDIPGLTVENWRVR
jgi:tRNA(fMet)-specific endonuclease VapC